MNKQLTYKYENAGRVEFLVWDQGRMRSDYQVTDGVNGLNKFSPRTIN